MESDGMEILQIICKCDICAALAGWSRDSGAVHEYGMPFACKGPHASSNQECCWCRTWESVGDFGNRMKSMTNQHPMTLYVLMSPLQDDGACVDDLTSLWARSSRFGFGRELIYQSLCVFVCAHALTLHLWPDFGFFLRKLAKCAWTLQHTYPKASATEKLSKLSRTARKLLQQVWKALHSSADHPWKCWIISNPIKCPTDPHI